MQHANWIAQAKAHWKEFQPTRFKDLQKSGQLLQALTAAFTFSYSLLLLWRRQAALPSMQRANIGLALLVAGALIPRIGYGWTASLMLGCGLLLAGAIGLAWRAHLWRGDAPGNALVAAPPAPARAA